MFRQPTGKRASQLRRLSGLTEQLIAPAMRKRAQILGKIIAVWPELAGDAHQWCLPIDLTFTAKSRINATLVVSVASGRGPQLQMMAADLCKNINSNCGYAAIGRITIRQNFSSARPVADTNRPERKPETMAQARLEKATSQIANPELRAALIKLGQSLA